MPRPITDLRLPPGLRAAVTATRLMSRSRVFVQAYGIAAYRTGEAVVRALGPGVTAWAALSDGGEVRVPLDDHGFRRLWLHGDYEPDIVAFARAVLRPGDTAVDVGANVGVHSLRFAALVGEHGRVHAFEPNDELVKVLRGSVRHNGWEDRVMVHDIALGEASGTGTLYVNDSVGLLSSITQADWLAESAEQTIQISRLDDVEAVWASPIRLLKVDVEGGELAVLRGGSSLIKTSPPRYLIVEVSSSVDAQPLVEWVSDRGYRPVMMIRQENIVPTTSPIPWLPVPTGAGPLDPGFEYANLLFEHRSA